MPADRHDFTFPQIGELEQTRDAFVPEVVPAQTGKLLVANRVTKRVYDPSARLHGKHRLVTDGCRTPLRLQQLECRQRACRERHPAWSIVLGLRQIDVRIFACQLHPNPDEAGEFALTHAGLDRDDDRGFQPWTRRLLGGFEQSLLFLLQEAPVPAVWLSRANAWLHRILKRYLVGARPSLDQL